jgi:hypothetical protein
MKKEKEGGVAEVATIGVAKGSHPLDRSGVAEPPHGRKNK